MNETMDEPSSIWNADEFTDFRRCLARKKSGDESENRHTKTHQVKVAVPWLVRMMPLDMKFENKIVHLQIACLRLSG